MVLEMDELISRKALLEELGKVNVYRSMENQFYLAKDIVLAAPTVDAVPLAEYEQLKKELDTAKRDLQRAANAFAKITVEYMDYVPLAEYERLKRERDAAVADLKQFADSKGSCFACVRKGGCDDQTCSKQDSKWEWRGVRDE